MTDPIAVTGVTSDLRVPGIFVQVAVGTGPVGGSSSDRPTVIVEPKLSSGTYTANVLYWPRSEAEVNAGAGMRSAAARAWRKARAANNTQRIGVICYAETSGGSPVAASTTIVVGGTTSTAADIATIGVADRDTSVPIAVGDTPTVVAGKLRTALGADPTVIVSGSTTNVILSYPHAGTRGGTSTYKPVKLTVNSPTGGITLTCPGDLGATTPGVEGSTTEATNLAAALNANSGVWIYNIVNSLGGNSTALTGLNAFLAAQALPRVGMRGTGITAFNGSISAGTAIAQPLNYERLTYVNASAFRNTPEEIAANIAALFAKYEAADRTFVFANYSGPDLLLTPVSDTTQWPDQMDNNDAILGGQMPIGIGRTGAAYIVDSTTTRIKDSTGTYTDYRAYKRHRVSGADDFADKVTTTLALNMRGKKLSPDPVDSSGRPVYTNQTPPGVIYPRTLKNYVANVARSQERAGQAQDSAGTVASLTVLPSTDNPERVLVQCNYRTIDQATQAACLIQEVTPG